MVYCGWLRREAHGVFWCILVVLATTSTTIGVLIDNNLGARSGGQQEDGTMPTTILVALEDGTAGADALRMWSSWGSDIALSTGLLPPPVWVVCSDPVVEASIVSLPHVQAFLVDGAASWASVLAKFMSQNHSKLPAVGLLGEGAIPHPDLLESIGSMRLSLGGAGLPTVILTRSRSTNGIAAQDYWLSDKFVSQIWCNRAMLEAPKLASAGLDAWAARDLSLLHAIALLIRDNDTENDERLLVDGTHAIPSLVARTPASSAFEVRRYAGFRLQDDHHTSPQSGTGRPPTGASIGDDIYIGRLGLALVSSDDDALAGETRPGATGGKTNTAVAAKASRIAETPWPPTYVLENVAMEATVTTSKGLILVTNVNCGYLDMATNFLLSVQNATGGDAKVLFVAMDVVSFDFMDALEPGCTVMHLRATKNGRNSIMAGTIGDERFAEAVLGRPFFIRSIIAQGYTALWSDADMVWLSNPLPLLPTLGKDSDVDMMLQHDHRVRRAVCTCFMFVNPTPLSDVTLRKWEESIIQLKSSSNQMPFQEQLRYMMEHGLRVEMLGRGVAPTGNAFFDRKYQQNYAELYHNETVIVHNNWVKGHDVKKVRFQHYRLWSVEDWSFPECTE